MTLSGKSSSEKPAVRLLERYRGFTLIEVMVALSIIAIGTTAALSVYAMMIKNASYDSRYEKGIEAAENYLSTLYLSTNLSADLLSPDEYSNVMSRSSLPVLLPPAKSYPAEGVEMLVNKNIRRWKPMLVDVGVEVIVSYEETNRQSRHYWIESTFSEAYLGKLN